MDHRRHARTINRGKARRQRQALDRLAARRGLDRRHPLLMHDHPEATAASLSLDNIRVSLAAPYHAAVTFFSTTDRLNTMRDLADDGLIGRGILPGDLLLFDCGRTAPEDGAIMWVEAAHPAYVARVCRVLADGRAEFRAAAPGFAVLSGERRIVGTLAAVVRATDGRGGAA